MPGLCASGRISPKRWEIIEFCFHYHQSEGSCYKMVHTASLWLLSFLRYIDIIVKFHEKWARTSSKSRSERKFANALIIIIIIRIKKYGRAMCFRSNISETVRDNRVLFSLSSIGRVMLPNGTYDVSMVVIVSEIYWYNCQISRKMGLEQV